MGRYLILLILGVTSISKYGQSLRLVKVYEFLKVWCTCSEPLAKRRSEKVDNVAKLPNTEQISMIHQQVLKTLNKTPSHPSLMGKCDKSNLYSRNKGSCPTISPPRKSQVCIPNWISRHCNQLPTNLLIFVIIYQYLVGPRFYFS